MATVTVTFPTPSNVMVTLVDGKSKAALDPQDYRWIIEEDRTWYQNPNCTTNPLPAGCPGASLGILPAYGTNFHTSHMPVVAEGCVGSVSCEQGQTVFDPVTKTHVAAACDIGNGVCRAATHKTEVSPGQAILDPAKRYYLSVMPGDAINGDGHAMGGAELVYDATANTWKPVKVIVEPMPLPTATVSAFVFEDDFPLNGEQDAGGGVDVLAPNEPGLGGFQVLIYDNVGQFGDPAGQMTYDMFNMPLSNALAGTIDPVTGYDACPISKNARTGVDGVTNDKGITGMIVTCPYYEADGVTRPRWPARRSFAICLPVSTESKQRRPPTRSHGASSGSRPIPWMAVLPTIRSSRRVSQAISRNTDPPGTTLPSASPTPESSTGARRVSALPAATAPIQ